VVSGVIYVRDMISLCGAKCWSLKSWPVSSVVSLRRLNRFRRGVDVAVAMGGGVLRWVLYGGLVLLSSNVCGASVQLQTIVKAIPFRQGESYDAMTVVNDTTKYVFNYTFPAVSIFISDVPVSDKTQDIVRRGCYPI